MGEPIPQPIPWADVVRWCAFHDRDEEEVKLMDRCFQSMDGVYLTHWASQAKARAETSRHRGRR